jgi:hypothetical protein
VSGPFDDLRYSVDIGAMATDVAKDALQRELERRLGGGKAGQAAGDQQAPPGLGSVRDRLRGILGGSR